MSFSLRSESRRSDLLRKEDNSKYKGVGVHYSARVQMRAFDSHSLPEHTETNSCLQFQASEQDSD